MKIATHLFRWLAPLACTLVATGAPLTASSGGSRGRWLEVSPRQTMLQGFIYDEEGVKSHRIEALLAKTSLSGGALYGKLESMSAPTEAATQSELLLFGEFADAPDGSARFAAIVVLSVQSDNSQHYFAAGTLRGALSARFNDGNVQIIGPIDPTMQGGGGSNAVEPILREDSEPVATPQEVREVWKSLLRTRAALRKMLSHMGVIPYEPVNTIVDQPIEVSGKGTFRARLELH